MVDSWINAHAEQAQMVLFFVLFAVFALVEAVAPRRPGPMRRKERWLANLLLTAINAVVLSLLPVTFLGAAVFAQERGWGIFNLLPLPLGVAVVGNLLARGFISFLTHYLMHKVPLCWRVHRVHHLDTELDVSTTVRFHPLEFLIGLCIGLPLVVVLGLSPWVLLLYELLDAGVTVFSHANLRLPGAINRLLCYLVVTPDLHRVHHSSWQPETNSNYGAVFPIWDLLFGTFRTQTQMSHEGMELGLKEVRDQRVNRWWWLLGSPFLRQFGSDRGAAETSGSAGASDLGTSASSRTKRTVIATGLLAVGLLAMGLLDGCGRYAHRRGYDHRELEVLTGKHLDYALDRIKATEEQRVQIRAIIERLSVEMKTADASSSRATQALREQWIKEQPDAALLHGVVDEQVEQMRRTGNALVDEMVALHQVLAPEQRVQLAEWMADHDQWSERRACR